MKKIAALLLGLALLAFNALAAVNINTATQEELETLNGIGPVRARAIIDYRAKNGPFKKIEELDNVPGIGQGVLSRIRGDVTLTGATTVNPEGRPAAKAEPRKTESRAADRKSNVEAAKKDAEADKAARKEARKTAKADKDDKDTKKEAKADKGKKEAKKTTKAEKDDKDAKKEAKADKGKKDAKKTAKADKAGKDAKKEAKKAKKSKKEDKE